MGEYAPKCLKVECLCSSESLSFLHEGGQDWWCKPFRENRGLPCGPQGEHSADILYEHQPGPRPAWRGRSPRGRWAWDCSGGEDGGLLYGRRDELRMCPWPDLWVMCQHRTLSKLLWWWQKRLKLRIFWFSVEGVIQGVVGHFTLLGIRPNLYHVT